MKPEDKTIGKLLGEAHKKIGSIGKNQKNEFHKYQFRGIDDLLNHVGPVFAELGIQMWPEVLSVQATEHEKGRGVDMLIQYTFLSVHDGSIIKTVVAGEAADNHDKSTNKAMSAALKYALIQTLLIPTKDMTDGDSQSPIVRGPVARTPHQQAGDRATKIAAEKGVTVTDLMAKFVSDNGLGSLAELNKIPATEIEIYLNLVSEQGWS